MVNHPEPKKAVALIRQSFSAQGAKLQTKAAYNLLAQLWGYQDWATYCGAHPEKTKRTPKTAQPEMPFARLQSELDGWQTWVVLMRWTDEGEKLFLLPPGVTLEDRYTARGCWQLVDDEDAVPLESGFAPPSEGRKTFQDLVVVTEVASQFPRVDRYGIPEFSNDREVAAWAQRDQGWGYLAYPGGSAVEVNAVEFGDDTSAVWWAQVLVHPTVHTRLLTNFGVNVEFSLVWPRVVPDEPYSVKPDSVEFDPRVVALRGSLGKVFADLDGMPFGDVMDALDDADDTSCEAFLRTQLNNDCVTVNGAYEAMSAAELRRHLVDAIASAEIESLT